MKKLFCILMLFSALVVCSCSDVYRYTDYSFFAMDTVITVTACENADFEGIEQAAKQTERLMSRTDSQSEIYKLNAENTASLSQPTAYVLEKALEISVATDGAFNPCIGTVVSLWDITSGKNIVPDDEEIEQALKYTDASKTDVKNRFVAEYGTYGKQAVEKFEAVSEEGIQVDLGGIAKGYSLQQAYEKLKQDGEENFCISFGGNVAVYGTSEANAKSKQKGWRVGITNPFDTEEIVGTLLLEDGIVSVSGKYERFFEKDGKKYHHIFDPKTGKPSQSDIESAAVMCSDGVVADALSTALVVMGSERAKEFYGKNLYDFQYIAVTTDGKILISQEIYDIFTLNEQAKNSNNKKFTVEKIS